jgi:RHS repeat-associated protein
MCAKSLGVAAARRGREARVANPPTAHRAAVPRPSVSRLVSALTSFALILASQSASAAGVELDYRYDANGNLIQGDGKYYEYNDANRLVRVRHRDSQGPVIAEYLYDSNGQRARKIEGEFAMYYVAGSVERFVAPDGASETNYWFVNGARVASSSRSQHLAYFHSDHLGSMVRKTDETAGTYDEVRYLPYGAVRTGVSQGYGFTGRERDLQSELLYFGARYYDPVAAHFAQPDTMVPMLYRPQTLNRYSYVDNNPLGYVDPTGHFKISVGQDVIMNLTKEIVVRIASHNLEKQGMRVLRSLAEAPVSGLVSNGGNILSEVEALAAVRNTQQMVKRMSGVYELASIAKAGYDEITDRGYTLHDLKDAYQHVGENVKFGLENRDALLNATIEGVTSTTAIVIKEGSLGVLDVSGKDVENLSRSTSALFDRTTDALGEKFYQWGLY